MKYKKAKYIEVLQCPECEFCKLEENDDMPDRDNFRYYTDYEGIDYIKCPCGCLFVEKGGVK